MSDVIIRNSSLTSLQSNVFFINPCPGEDGEDRITSSVTNDQATRDFIVFPNPVNTMLNVSNTACNSSIKLYNASGLLLKNIENAPGRKDLQIDVHNLAPGMYFISVTSDKKSKSLKFLKTE